MSELARKIRNLALLALLELSILVLLYIFRGYDDNATVRWGWTVNNPILFILIIIISLISGYIFMFIRIKHKKTAIFLAAFFVSAIFWREPEIIIDASRYFTYAKMARVDGLFFFLSEWGRGFAVWTDLPGIPLLHALIFEIFGEGRLVIQIFNSVLFSLTAVLVYLTGRELWNRETGITASIFFFAFPFIYSQIPLFLIDIPAMFFFSLSLYTFIRAVKKGGLWIPAASLAIVYALFAKYSLWFYLLPLPLLMLRRNKKRGVISLSLAALIFILIFYIKSDVFIKQIELLKSYQLQGLKRWGESFTSTFLFQISPFLSLAAILSLIEGYRKKDINVAIISAFILPVFLLHIDRIRYILPVFPALALLSSRGIANFGRRRGRFLAASAAIFSVLLALFFYLPFNCGTSASNLQQTGNYLNSVKTDSIGVLPLIPESYINPRITIPLLDIYTGKKISVIPYSYSKPPKNKLMESPFRFTWEYKLPDYYKTEGKPEIFVLITQKKNQKIPEKIEKELKKYKEIKEFGKSQGLFSYNTLVSIYKLS